MGTFSVRKTTHQFVVEAKSVHGDKYDYSKTQYLTNREKVLIICPIHGDFWQRPSDHLSGKYGCPKCARIAVDSSRDRTKNPFYPKWCGMRRRCNEKELANTTPMSTVLYARSGIHSNLFASGPRIPQMDILTAITLTKTY